MCHFPEALRLVGKLSEKTASEDPSATRGALRATHLGIALLSKAEKNDMPLDIEAAAHKQGLKQNETFIGRAFYLYVASLL